MPHRNSGWTRLLREHGPAFLESMVRDKTLESRLKLLASAFKTLVSQQIRCIEDVCDVWRAVPEVVKRCNKQSTYAIPGATIAYAWLHLLDRYARTWSALVKMTESACLPLGRFGVQALDIGTGPGPSAFAINDFYDALTVFAEQTGLGALQQPPKVVCVEFDSATNHLRHHLAEIAWEQGGRVSDGLLSMCSAVGDFGSIMPSADRVAMQETLRVHEEKFYNEADDCWEWDRIYTAEEANAMAQSIHRYRLFTFSNFLTTIGTVKRFETNIVDLFTDAQPGSAILTLGGRGDPYPKIYNYVKRLADKSGFTLVFRSEVSSLDGGMSEHVSIGRQLIYDLFEDIAPDSKVPLDVFNIKERYRRPARARAVSQIWSYRKYGRS